MEILQDPAREPSMAEIADTLTGGARPLWDNLTGFIAEAFGSKPSAAYSRETRAWNVKYKKGGKALGTLYPQGDAFTVLVVLNAQDMQRFEQDKPGYTPYIRDLYDHCTLYNRTKWLMAHITDEAVLADVKSLMLLKLQK